MLALRISVSGIPAPRSVISMRHCRSRVTELTTVTISRSGEYAVAFSNSSAMTWMRSDATSPCTDSIGGVSTEIRW